MSESSFRTRAREIAGYLYSINLPYSTRFFRLYPWHVTPRGAPVKCQDLPRPPQEPHASDGLGSCDWHRSTAAMGACPLLSRLSPAAAQCTGAEPIGRGGSFHFTGAPLGVTSHGYSRKNRVLYGIFIE